jgi:hypothetical protein
MFDIDSIDQSRDWIELASNNELAYHGLYYAVKVHQDMLAGRALVSQSRDALASKVRIISLLREGLSQPNEGNFEAMIAGMLSLGVNEVEPDAMANASGYAFEAYLPNANWHNVYGRFDFAMDHMLALSSLL